MNIKDMIAEKRNEKNIASKLDLNDINRDLIISIFSVNIYGKPANEDDILEIIIGKDDNKIFDKIRAEFEEIKKESGSKLRKGKDGYLRNKDGFLVLKPKG